MKFSQKYDRMMKLQFQFFFGEGETNKWKLRRIFRMENYEIQVLPKFSLWLLHQVLLPEAQPGLHPVPAAALPDQAGCIVPDLKWL